MVIKVSKNVIDKGVIKPIESAKKSCCNCECYWVYAENAEGYCRKFKLKMSIELSEIVYCDEFDFWWGTVE